MRQKILGIGGGIGSGKSTISHFFYLLGFPVYNADAHAKRVYFHPEIKKKVIELIGESAYISAVELNKKYIADTVFSNRYLLEKLNQIIHPAVQQHFLKWCNNHSDHTMIIKESALLFENGLNNDCFKTILVDVPSSVRIERVMKRDQLTNEQVQQRINNQKKPELFYATADLVIQNDNSSLILPKLLDWINNELIKSNLF